MEKIYLIKSRDRVINDEEVNHVVVATSPVDAVEKLLQGEIDNSTVQKEFPVGLVRRHVLSVEEVEDSANDPSGSPHVLQARLDEIRSRLCALIKEQVIRHADNRNTESEGMLLVEDGPCIGAPTHEGHHKQITGLRYSTNYNDVAYFVDNETVPHSLNILDADSLLSIYFHIIQQVNGHAQENES